MIGCAGWLESRKPGHLHHRCWSALGLSVVGFSCCGLAAADLFTACAAIPGPCRQKHAKQLTAGPDPKLLITDGREKTDGFGTTGQVRLPGCSGARWACARLLLPATTVPAALLAPPTTHLCLPAWCSALGQPTPSYITNSCCSVLHLGPQTPAALPCTCGSCPCRTPARW